VEVASLNLSRFEDSALTGVIVSKFLPSERQAAVETGVRVSGYNISIDRLGTGLLYRAGDKI